MAHRFWRGKKSGLEAWHLIKPNRASCNIGEFAIIMPGKGQIVVTKEVYIFRVIRNDLFDPFYLLWALSLQVVRDQWRPIALMPTNREDCGNRYREIMIPQRPDKSRARKKSKAFSEYFTTIANARETFHTAMASDALVYVVSASSFHQDGTDSNENHNENELVS